jgi:hypothetical protein
MPSAWGWVIYIQTSETRATVIEAVLPVIKLRGRRGWERMVQDRMVEEACPEAQGALALIGRHRQAAAFNSVNQTGGTRCSDSF